MTFPKQKVLAKRGSGNSEHIEITLGKLKQHSVRSCESLRALRRHPWLSGRAIYSHRRKDATRLSKDSIGIGTADPQGKLHIKGHSLVIEGQSNNAGHNTPGLLLIDTHALKVDKAPAWGIDQLQDRFRIFSQANLLTAGLERLSIDKDGNVGIGTEDPQGKLHIKGHSLVVEGKSDNVGQKTPTLLLVDTNVSEKWGLDQLKGRFRIFSQNNYNLSIESLTITNTGNVGIRTGNPQELLQLGDFGPNDNYLKIFAGKSNSHPGCAGIKLECGEIHHGYTIVFNNNLPRVGLRFDRHLPKAEPRTDLFLDFIRGDVQLNGPLLVEKDLTVNGNQMLNRGRLKKPDIGTLKGQLQGKQYSEGCLILFIGDDEHLNYLLKKADGKVEHRTISSKLQQ